MITFDLFTVIGYCFISCLAGVYLGAWFESENGEVEK